MIEMNDTTLRAAIPSSVRGMVRMRQMIAETNAQTTEHDEPSVTVPKISAQGILVNRVKNRTSIESNHSR